MQPVYLFTYHEKSAFIPLRYVYPECEILRADHPQTEGMQCLATTCPANRNCMDVLARRIHYIFDNVVPNAQLLVVYFKNSNGSIKAALFDRDFSEPRIITCNRSAFSKFQKGGVVHEWIPATEYTMIRGNNELISISNLLRT